MNGRLYHQFSRLFELTKLKGLSVKDFCEIWHNQEIEISMLWRRHLRAWELDEKLKLDDLIEGLVFSD